MEIGRESKLPSCWGSLKEAQAVRLGTPGFDHPNNPATRNIIAHKRLAMPVEQSVTVVCQRERAPGWTCPAGLLAVTGLAVVAAISAAQTGEGPDDKNCFKAQCKLSIQKEQAEAAQYSAATGFAQSPPAQIEV
jgi:hypothetical protein